jgi:quercetin dioxygenase-like cupin family protein
MTTNDATTREGPPTDASPTRVGELYENPVTGERGVVRIAPRQSNGHLLVVDLYVRPGGAVAGEHVHPMTTETFTVVRGELGIRHDGRELRAGPGARLRIAPGTAHAFWNAGTEEARVLVEVQPGDRFVHLIRQLFLLAQDGRTDTKGRPTPLRAAVIGREFADTIRFTTLPQLIQRLLIGVLSPVAVARGHRALDPAYGSRELPTVDLEPLPAEIVDLVPSLTGVESSGRHLRPGTTSRSTWPNSTTISAGR